MSNLNYTNLPVAGSANLTDITSAIQGYVPSVNPGTLTQQTWQQVFNLFNSNIILNYAGNPNGNVAGTLNQLCWDTVDKILYICTLTGTTSTAVWSKTITLVGGSGVTVTQNGNIIEISASSSGVSFNKVNTNTDMVTNNAYIASSSSLIELLLPSISSVGDVIYVTGYYSGSGGGWKITQASGQQIIIDSVSTTLGSGGSLASTNQNDGIQLYCVVSNTIWKNINGSQGALTYV